MLPLLLTVVAPKPPEKTAVGKFVGRVMLCAPWLTDTAAVCPHWKINGPIFIATPVADDAVLKN